MRTYILSVAVIYKQQNNSNKNILRIRVHTSFLSTRVFFLCNAYKSFFFLLLALSTNLINAFFFHIVVVVVVVVVVAIVIVVVVAAWILFSFTSRLRTVPAVFCRFFVSLSSFCVLFSDPIYLYSWRKCALTYPLLWKNKVPRCTHTHTFLEYFFHVYPPVTHTHTLAF